MLLWSTKPAFFVSHNSRISMAALHCAMVIYEPHNSVAWKNAVFPLFSSTVCTVGQQVALLCLIPALTPGPRRRILSAPLLDSATQGKRPESPTVAAKSLA